MNPIRKKILLYSELSAEGRLHLEAQVQGNPELMPLLEEAKAFSSLLGDARLLLEDPPSDEALAYYLVVRARGGPRPPDALTEAIGRLQSKLAQHPPLAVRLDALEQRMRELEAASDPAAHFERLTGHKLSARPPAVRVPVSRLRAADHLPRANLWGRKLTRWAAAAVLVLGALYGTLFSMSRASESELDRLAAIDGGLLEVASQGLRTRGALGFDAGSSDAMYLEAVTKVRASRRAVLGLFPRYDQALLRDAASLLEQVIVREDPDSYLQLEASFLLGKVRLALEEPVKAAAALQAVIDGQGRSAPEAHEILTSLRALQPRD